MTRLASLLVAAMLLAGPTSTAFAQGTAASSIPHKVALIDISRVLKDTRRSMPFGRRSKPRSPRAKLSERRWSNR
ncbi:MAG: hypothetical protein CM1200mP2_46570 [Planctomycetaceae bacterium]|nr:MAG: hypothetical protein CM1200mP2_46570 [Planctomycetaceae bacterium]